jgi:hypothetical protein
MPGPLVEEEFCGRGRVLAADRHYEAPYALSRQRVGTVSLEIVGTVGLAHADCERYWQRRETLTLVLEDKRRLSFVFIRPDGAIEALGTIRPAGGPQPR